LAPGHSRHQYFDISGAATSGFSASSWKPRTSKLGLGSRRQNVGARPSFKTCGPETREGGRSIKSYSS